MNELVSKALGERFSFTLKNTTGAKVVVAILAAYFDTLSLAAATTAEGDPLVYTTAITKKFTDAAAIKAAGYDCDHVLDDGTIVTNLVAASSNSKMSIRAFREFIKNEGRVLVDMSVQANNVAAFNETLEVVKCSPLRGSAPQYLPLNEFRSVDQSATDKVNVRQIGLEMTYDTLMLLPIENGHEISLSFKFS
jgi:hypothetical protein